MYEKGDFVAFKGNIYMRHEAGKHEHYRRLELYLPSAEGTLGEPIETTFYKWVERLEKGLLAAKCADGVRYVKSGDKMVPIKKEKKA